MHQLEQFFNPKEIWGVELNSTHLQIGKRFFDLDRKPFHLVRGDAIQWLKTYRGEPFDLIIDDMFGEDHGEPFRVARADKKWLESLGAILSSQGSVV